MSQHLPGYIKFSANGVLQARVNEAYAHLAICDVCALRCPVNRLAGKLGACRTGERVKISSFAPHHGEEYPLSGWNGSGTIFFTRCNLKCVYCQNHDISQTDFGEDMEIEDIAVIMLKLQEYGCHNINFVSPSHVIPQIMAAILIAANAGLHIPLVYNTGGYDSLQMLKLLEGVIDIYMPDMKYSAPEHGLKYSRIPNYPEVNQAAVKEMHRQVGDLRVDSSGIAVRGLLIRHLVLPNALAGTEKIVKFIADELSPNTYLNLMDQYRPAYKAHIYPELNRLITAQEYRSAVELANTAGLHRSDGRDVAKKRRSF